MNKARIKFFIAAAGAAMVISACGQAPSGNVLPEPGEMSIGFHEVAAVEASQTSFSPADVPAYSGEAYTVVNGNVPFFAQSDLTDVSFESYAEMDSLGRCGPAYASVGRDLMPDKERGAIGQVKPSGWQTVKYDIVDGKYLYNRCHLIGYQLTGENANEKNLITGTRYMNVTGMLPFENMVADYVKETGNHVLYRVTPVFEGDNLVASGLLIEAESVEDTGKGILFCVYVYNVQPGITIDYQTGASALAGEEEPAGPKETLPAPSKEAEIPWEEIPSAQPEEITYILNKNTKKFHYPSCSSVREMKESNKKNFTGTRDEAISQGYSPCGRCHP